MPSVPMAGRAAAAPQARANDGPHARLLRGRAAFDALAPDWDALLERSGNDQLFYRHWFLATWLDHLGTDAQLCVATLHEDGRLVAALPLLRRRVRMHGLPVQALCSMGNLHSCRFDMLAEDPQRAAPALLTRLLQEPDWQLLRLEDVPPDSRADALLPAARAAGLATGRWHSLVSPCVPVSADADSFRRALGSKLRTSLRRRRQKLATRGTVRLGRVGGGAGLDAVLLECLAVEAAGWKGRNGTAIASEPGTRGFYTGVAREAARNGALALWTLRVDGRLVAFQLAIEHGRRVLLLKQGYDEAFADCGPGQLLMEDVLEDCARRGLAELDLLGDDAPAKRTWTAHARQHAWLFVMRGPRGRLLHALKFRLAPALRRLRAAIRREQAPCASGN